MEEVSSSQVVLLGALYNTAQEYDTSATWEYTGPQLELVTCLLVVVHMYWYLERHRKK